MANLIEYIQSQVYENSTEDISGSIMQQVLTRMASDEGVVNVHTISGQSPFADYNNAQAARDAVPAGFKKLGLIITYKLSSGWYIDEFIGSATSGWSTSSNWKCLGPISVSQNASTGKTTITIGSESFDVATQPVSVSQNTLSIGSEKVGELAGQLIENPEWVQVVTDSEDKILYGVKTDGKFYFGGGCPPQVVEYIQDKINELSLDEYEDIVTFLGDLIDGDTLATLLNAKLDKEGLDPDALKAERAVENLGFIEVTTDSENKILEGITSDGKKVIEIPIEIQGVREEVVDSAMWIEAKIDTKSKIIEGINSGGEKHISKFDDETKQLIKGFVGDTAPSIINIPLLDANFNSPVPVTITGTKGDENAKYEFELPLKESWLIRFKFRITENLLNQEKNADIAIINNLKVFANVIPLTQHQETVIYEDVERVVNWPTVDGGIAFNRSTINQLVQEKNLGNQAFSIKYVGNGDDVTIENNGTAIILSVDGNETSYLFSNYDNMSELFAAMLTNTDFELQYIALDQRTCDELAVFDAIKLKDTFYCDTTGTFSPTIAPHVDCAPFYLYYAVSSKWHQAEILKIGNTIYSVCDGTLYSRETVGGDNKLILGGGCGVLFKDFTVCCNGTLDAEIVNGRIVSDVSPSIIIFECHGMHDSASYEVTPATTEDGMSSLTPDAMEYFYSYLESKGYAPVSIEEVAEYYTAGTPLPKRCYVHIFDDRRWNICLNNAFRSVYSRHGAKPALALYGASIAPGEVITHNGNTITQEQAAAICKNAGFSLISHTAQHRVVSRSTLPSDYIAYFTNDIYEGDDMGVNASIIVYPGGANNVYSHDVMEYLGMKLGIEVYHGNRTINITHNRFYLSRIDIGRIIAADGEPINYQDEYLYWIL